VRRSLRKYPAVKVLRELTCEKTPMAYSQVSEIVGQWVEEAEDGIRRDESAKLIRQLTASEGGRFHELATAEAGGSTLYRDPADGRLWEKTFPQSELHGGGPPRLNVLSEEEARDKYGSGVFAPTAP
jgi:hypothetical protein